MNSRTPILLLTLSLISALLPAHAAFVNNDTSGITQIVDFNEFTSASIYGDSITDTLIPVFTSGAFTINMNVPNYSASAVGDIRVGITTLISNAATTDAYLFSNSTTADNAQGGSGQQILEFSLAGGAVSTIGIRLTPLTGFDLSDIRIEAFNAAGDSLDFFTITSASNPSLSGLPIADDASDAGFFGISSASSDIVRFRIIGGLLALDDLGFGGLQLAGGDPDPDPEPEPGEVPEPSSMLLCASALGLLSLGSRSTRVRALFRR